MGVFDPTGIADITSSILSLKNGEYRDAFSNLLGVVPIVGDLPKAGKVINLVDVARKTHKHHLKIKKFLGTSENAVRIQIYSAIIDYCMTAIVQKKMNIDRSIYEIL